MAPHIRSVSTILLVFFLIIAGNLGYWQLFRADDIRDDPLINRYRNLQEELNTQRGSIVDRDGTLLVNTDRGGQSPMRVYVAPWVAPITAFHSIRFGSTGIEETYDSYLTGVAGLDAWTSFTNRLFHRPLIGNNLVLSIDADIQVVAEQALGNARGAVVAINPKTGGIIALVTHPNFNATNIDETWETIRNAEGNPLLNRGTQGLYVPGSTFKAVTAVAGLDLGLIAPDTMIHLDRKLDRFGRISAIEEVCGFPPAVYDANVDRNDFDFTYGFAKSSNVAFARLGVQLGANQLSEYARRFGWEREIPLEIPVSVSQLQGAPNRLRDCALLSATAYGQGELLATPLQMALVSAAIANEGMIMQPYLVERVQTREGQVINQTQPRPWSRVMRPETAPNMVNLMITSVDIGYASQARIPNVKVGGKTGTAEVGPGGQPHAWFIGFAPAENPQIAIAVIRENAGQGGTQAAPIAKAVMEAVINRR